MAAASSASPLGLFLLKDVLLVSGDHVRLTPRHKPRLTHSHLNRVALHVELPQVLPNLGPQRVRDQPLPRLVLADHPASATDGVPKLFLGPTLGLAGCL